MDEVIGGFHTRHCDIERLFVQHVALNDLRRFRNFLPEFIGTSCQTTQRDISLLQQSWAAY